MSYKKIILLTIMILSIKLNMFAGSPDPERAALYAIVTATQSKALAAQDAALGLTLAGYKMNGDVIRKTNKFMKEYNDWLNSFGDVLTIAANLYGIYYNVDRIIKDISEFQTVTKVNPKNVIAVSLSPSKNKIYNSILQDGLELVSDLEIMATGTKTTVNGKTKVKMKAKLSLMERTMMIIDVRQRLQAIDRELCTINRYIRYTSLYDTYFEVTGDRPYKNHHTRSLDEIITDCKNRWTYSLGKARYGK